MYEKETLTKWDFFKKIQINLNEETFISWNKSKFWEFTFTNGLYFIFLTGFNLNFSELLPNHPGSSFFASGWNMMILDGLEELGVLGEKPYLG